uniref:phospholipase A1 n=1 Tax=Bombus ignitus TaxID=130704 RepID=B0LXE0_BOMIG|nr:lipase [Bombus ignitus]ACA25601.1 lipase [Bombus ignitus]ACA64425.1 lipase [Bombus ignitus]
MTAMVNASLVLFYPTLLSTLREANYTILPTKEGNPSLVKLDNTILSETDLILFGANVDTISFTLYTQKNSKNGDVLRLNDINSVRKSNWNANRQTIVVTHGWNSNGQSESCTLVRDAFLKVRDCNVIVVDWSQIADHKDYIAVAKNVPRVASRVASFINFLRTSAGLHTSNLKIIGHSLGAHVAGLSAREVGKLSRVAEVIALDPAKPLFEHKGTGERVDKSDAQNVQVIHTCAGYLGLDISVGTSDFFANDGRHQPGCGDDLLGSCAHGRSYEYFSQSITNPKAYRGVTDSGAAAYMGGANLDPKARGTYHFKTSS